MFCHVEVEHFSFKKPRFICLENHSILSLNWLEGLHMFTVKPIQNYNSFLAETRREGRLLRAAFGPLVHAFTVPLADVFETTKEIVVKFDLPGVSRKDIAVDVHEKLLHVKAEKNVQKVESTKNVSRFERARTGYERAVWLPQVVDVDHISTSYKAGVLEVHLPKLSF